MDLLVGIITGMTLVGASVQRIQDIIKGRVLRVFLGCVVISFAHYYMVNFATRGDLSGYIGFSIGATLITCYQSFTNINKNVNIGKKS